MGNAPEASMPETMYNTRAEETLCICADGNGLSIRLLDDGHYQLNEGVTGWSDERILDWAHDILSIYEHETNMLYGGGVDVIVKE